MPVELVQATEEDAADLVALRAAVNRRLLAGYGEGLWLAKLTEKGALFAMRRARLFVARHRGRAIAMLALSTRKPWAIDAKYFTPCARPLYLTSMAVDPQAQRKGIGRQCIEAARRIAKEWPADAIRLDAYDLPAGAGGFYAKCGFRRVGNAVYRGAPLVYYEMIL